MQNLQTVSSPLDFVPLADHFAHLLHLGERLDKNQFLQRFSATYATDKDQRLHYFLLVAEKAPFSEVVRDYSGIIHVKD